MKILGITVVAIVMIVGIGMKISEIYPIGFGVHDNIYQERYMGLPQEDKSVFIKGSPIGLIS